jgi:DNA transposition AAA+ family ATPase
MASPTTDTPSTATVDWHAPAANAPATELPPKGPGGSNFTIRGDIISAATAGLSDRPRNAIRWLAGYCQRTNQSHQAVAAKLKKPDGTPYSPDSLYHAFTGGRLERQLDNIVEAIERFQRLTQEREHVTHTGFIENRISRKIWNYCRKVIRRRKVGLIYGPSQIGKTISLEEYAKVFNHGETRYLRLPVGCGFKLFLRLLAAQLHVPIYQNIVDLRDAIIGAVDDHMLLIIDEMHEPFGPDGDQKLGVQIVNFLRELHDRKKCGLILCGTAVFREALTLGGYAKNMQQILRRSLPPLNLPLTPSADDLAKFAEAYGLGPAPDQTMGVKIAFTNDAGRDETEVVKENPFKLQEQVCRVDGLGRWCMILQEAEDIAREKKRPITWGLVLHAWRSFERDVQFDAPKSDAT